MHPSTRQQNKKPSFFKIFFPDITGQQLEIPKAFLKHLEGEYYGPAFLTCPAGKVSHMSLVEKSNGVFLQCGWQTFVKNHSLHVGHCLVFAYDGKLRFRVQIFDTNACEAPVESCCCSSTDHGSHDEEDTVGTKGKSSPNLCSCRQRRNRNPESLSEEDELNAPKFHEKSSHVHKTAATKVGYKRRRRQDGRTRLFSGNRPLISQRRPVTVEEIERAYKAAKTFKSKHPFCLVIMRKYSVYKRFFLALPTAFIKSSLPLSSMPMTLCDPSGKNWKTRYIYNPKYRLGGMSGGWMHFSHGNNLEVNDVCVFELVERDKMRVHIFRVVEELTPLLKLAKMT